MSFIGNAVGSIVGGITGASKAADAANDASRTQAASAQAGIDEQRRQFDALQAALAPYVKGGTAAFAGLGDLTGLNGTAAQQAAISGIQSSPEFTALQQQGENSILQNASATGGLRGGNTQAALAQFSPALLAQTINNRYAQLGGLASIGQSSAAGVGNAGLQTGSNIAQLLQQQGAAVAGGQLASGNVNRQAFSDLLKIGSTAVGFSDRRLKRNIFRIGTTARGNALYRWDWIDGSGSAEGVIADEVAHIPGALVAHPSGFAQVNYGVV